MENACLEYFINACAFVVHLSSIVDILVTFECADQSQHLCHLVGKPTMWIPNRSDINQTVQSQLEILSLSRRGSVLSE